VQAVLLVPQQPVHGLLLGGAPDFEFQTMQALNLQRAKHRLAARESQQLLRRLMELAIL